MAAEAEISAQQKAEVGRRVSWCLGAALDLGPPPADADEEESPVFEEFRRLAFEGMADELEDPSQDEEGEGIGPEAVDEDAGHKDCH